MSHLLRSPRMKPGERRALGNELLAELHLYRKKAAMEHGLGDPGPRYEIDPEDAKEDDDIPAASRWGVPAYDEEAEPPEPDDDDEPTDVDDSASPVGRLDSIAGSLDRMANAVEHSAPDTSTAEAIDRMNDTIGAAAGQQNTDSTGEKDKKPSKLAGAAKWAGIAALVSAAAAAPTIGSKLLSSDEPDPPAVVAPTPQTSLLEELRNRGLDVAPTDLGRDIEKAFELNPQLREKLIQDVQRTLEEHGVNGQPSGPAAPTPAAAAPDGAG